MVVLLRGSYLKGRAVLKRYTLELPLPGFWRAGAVRGTAVDVCQDTWHKFALMHPVQPGPGDCLQRVLLRVKHSDVPQQPVHVRRLSCAAGHGAHGLGPVLRHAGQRAVLRVPVVEEKEAGERRLRLARQQLSQQA